VQPALAGPQEVQHCDIPRVTPRAVTDTADLPSARVKTDVRPFPVSSAASLLP
jgi:hypothetical protein